MKTTKKLMLFVATLFVATFALSSCLSDDNETKVPTVEEQAGYQRTMYQTKCIVSIQTVWHSFHKGWKAVHITSQGSLQSGKVRRD